MKAKKRSGKKINKKYIKKAARRRIALLALTCASLLFLALGVLFLDEFEAYGVYEQRGEAEKYSGDIFEQEQGEQLQEEEAQWNLILVNRNHPFPEDYQVNLVEVEGGEQVDERIYFQLCGMLKAAEEDSVYLMVVSGYRTPERQQQLLDEKTEDYKREGYTKALAETKAAEWVAIPGTSEHQIGIAVDINADGKQSEGAEVYNWLEQNAARFGFIRRYPPDKTNITGVMNEPWHYRYVGVEAAGVIQDQGICLEEYLEQI